jgi:hypothetical protein
MEKKVSQVPSFTRLYPVTEHSCAVCGAGFTGPAFAKYCSAECRRRADWQRNGKNYNSRRKEKRG